MTFKQLFTASIFCVFFNSAFSQGQDNLSRFISNACDSMLSTGEIKSLSIAVIRNGKAYKFHKGQLITGEVPNDQTLYEIASLTKTFTGTLLAQAILDDKVKLDDDVRSYLPERYPNLAFNEKPITFRSLVTHTSGLPNMFPNRPELFENPDWNKLPFEINSLQAGYTKKQFLEELHQISLTTESGQHFSYSNVGANLLALCLEHMYGTSYEDLNQRILLEPLKMQSTYIGISYKNRPFLAKGMNVNGLEMPERAQKELMAEGGIISTVDDMIKYMRFNLNKDHPLIQISQQELFNGRYGNFENGLFWQILKDDHQPRRIYQNGGAFGTSSWLTLIPEHNSGVFIITPISGPEVHQKLNYLADLILNYKE